MKIRAYAPRGNACRTKYLSARSKSSKKYFITSLRARAYPGNPEMFNCALRLRIRISLSISVSPPSPSPTCICLLIYVSISTSTPSLSLSLMCIYLLIYVSIFTSTSLFLSYIVFDTYILSLSLSWFSIIHSIATKERFEGWTIEKEHYPSSDYEAGR